MFDLPDALFIGSLLFHFVFPETLFNCGVPVGFCMRVEDPDIHKGAFEGVLVAISSLALSVHLGRRIADIVAREER